MSQHDDEFDDPALKSAIQRAVGREAAPHRLRARITSLLMSAGAADVGSEPQASAPSAPGSHGEARRRRLVVDRQFWRVSALAAGVLLAFGWLGYQIRQEFFPPSPYPAGMNATVTAIPASLVLELVRTHDNCAKLPDHHLVPGNDPEALRERLSAEVSITASTISLGADWQFKGAGVCTVGGQRAAHLLFVRQDEHLSIFSMPMPMGCAYGTHSYRDTVEQHPIAGFTRGEALYCLVGSSAAGKFTLDELDRVLQQVQASFAVGCIGHDGVFTAAAAAAATRLDNTR